MAQNSTSTLLNSIQLKKIRQKAIRAGVWFKALHRIDRALVDLTIKVAVNIRSSQLVHRLNIVTSMLEELLESGFVRLTRTVGCLLTKKISVIGNKLGNAFAKDWLNDMSFATYLAAMYTNNQLQM